MASSYRLDLWNDCRVAAFVEQSRSPNELTTYHHPSVLKQLITPPFKIPQSFDEFRRMTQAELRLMRGLEDSARQLKSKVLDTVEHHLTEIVTRLEGGTMPDQDTIRQHTQRLINDRTKDETYSWRGIPILRLTYNQQCPPERWGTDYISLTILV